MDSGKSTLVAVLTQGRNGDPSLDSGRGSARMAVLKHKHELESGRTSSLSQQLLGYDEEGNVLNYRGVSGQLHAACANMGGRFDVLCAACDVVEWMRLFALTTLRFSNHFDP